MAFLSTFLVAAFAVAVAGATYLPPHSFHCPAPRAPHYGRYRSSDHYQDREYYLLGHVIYYECDDGYELHGTTWDACTYDNAHYRADWRFQTPVCKR